MAPNKEIIQNGKVLIAQGETPGFIPLLHSGRVEILSAPGEFEGLDAEIVISKSKRVGVLQGEMLISGFNPSLAGPYKKSLRVIEDAAVTKYPVNDSGAKQIIKQNPNFFLKLLNHLFDILELSISEASKYAKLYQNLNKIDDNIALLHKSLGSISTYEKMQNRSDSLYNIFTSNGGRAPSVFDAKFLISDNSQFLKKKYSFPGLPIESVIDYKQCQFIKKFLKLNANISGSAGAEDPSMLADTYEILSENLLKALERIQSIHNEIDNTLSALFGNENSWASFLSDGKGFNSYLNTNRINTDFIKNFLVLIKKIHGMYQEISGKSLIETYGGCKKIHRYYTGKQQGGGKAAAVSEPIAAGDAVSGKTAPSVKKNVTTGPYKNSMQQIFEFALIDKEMQNKMLKTLNEFKNMNDPFNTEVEGRKVRKFVAKLYWDIYKQVYLRSQKEEIMPPPVKLMLKFGFFDEDLLDDGQIQELHNLVSQKGDTGDIPIMVETEFLKKIHIGRENPSITEMGQTYETFLRDEENHGKKEDDKLSSLDENTKKVLYEIEHRLAMTVAIGSGSTSTAFPILNSFTIKGSFNNNYINPEKLAQIVKELISLDYSVFYRETVVKLGNAREVIEEDVIPNFILLPCAGTKTMLWQELDGTNRKTRGRIVVPIFFMGDITKSLAHSFACFRWELNRTIKGGMWADPVEGGITGLYFDYVNFYKKNKKLSLEAKEKITEKFRSIRTNRDRFADDYTMWVLFEKDGIMRVNSVIRDMFYRNIPFKKEIRSKLENMPAYNEIAPRYKNIQNRNITAYERKYKKYIGENGKLPDELQKYMDFLNT